MFQRHSQKKTPNTWLLKTQERAEFGYRLLIGGKMKGKKPKNLLSCGTKRKGDDFIIHSE